jgi:hypothetical protein
VIEKRGRKAFSKGLWAPSDHIAAARAALDAERGTEAYARRREADARRRAKDQDVYAREFEEAIATFLRFSKPYAALERDVSARVAAHAVPVGSGTVARTQRIPIEQRAQAAVIAWMRHQTTAYDNLKIPRIKGARREVRRGLAEISRAVLDLHRGPDVHGLDGCPLCRACAKPVASSPAP